MVSKLRVQEKLQKPKTYNIDFQLCKDDELFEGKELLDYLKSTMKVNDKKGNLADHVELSIEKSKVKVVASVKFSKRYLKYLTKKFLKKKDIVEFLRLVAVDKNSYKIKYVNQDATEQMDK